MWNRKRSVKLSIAVCGALAVLIAAMVTVLPFVYNWDNGGMVYSKAGLIGNGKAVICITLYISAAIIYFAFYHLIKLLLNIMKNDIFIASNVRALRIISWCCFAVSAVIFAGGILALPLHLFTFVTVAVAACFGGLLLRVVKNVMQSAVELREESDLTI